MGRRTILLITALVVAALGTALVFLYVRSADDRALAGQEQVQVLFATQQIPVGQSAETASTNGSLELRTVAANSVAEGALSDIDPIANEVALTTIFPGQQIVSAAFGDVTGVSAIPIPDNLMALSLQLGDPERVAGFLGAGSEVAVFVTLSNPNPAAQGNDALSQQTSLLIPRVQVITVGNVQPVTQTTTTTDGQQNTEEIPRAIVTLAVDQEQAQRLIFASQQGQLYFTLLTENSKVGVLPPTNGANITK
jgi:pilus assembly protein CpaB